jgi:hypothetical protein
MVDPSKTGNSNCRWPQLGTRGRSLPQPPPNLIVADREKQLSLYTLYAFSTGQGCVPVMEKWCS